MQITVVKSVYFFLYVAFAAWLSFFYVFLKEEPGLNGVEIGVIAAIQQISSILIVPLWGVWADKIGRKRVFCISLALSTFGILGFFYQGNFAFYMLFMICFTSFYNPLTSLIDSIALDIEELYEKVSYGELRLWASIGWATSTITTGYFIKYFGISNIFPLASVLLGFTLLLIIFLYKPISREGLKAHEVVKTKVIFELIKNSKPLFYFLILIIVFTTFSSPIHLFINLYFNEIKASSEEIGWAFAIQSLCELPFFFYGNRIIKQFGVKKVMIFTMTITAIRMYLYSQISSPIFAIIIGTSHGICLALFLVAMVNFIHRIVPNNLKSTGQSLLYTAFAIGVCIGNLLTGYIKDIASIQTAMFVFGCIVMALTFALPFVHKLLNINTERLSFQK